MANGKERIRVHVPFSLTNLAQCKQRPGWCSEDPSKFVEGFHALTLVYDLTWNDVQVVLSTCCTPEEKQRIWTAAQGHADQFARDQPKHYAVGGDTVPNQKPPWRYNSREGMETRKHMIQCILERMRKCIKKSVNYEKVKEKTHEEKENPALFHGSRVEDLESISA